MDRRAGSGTPVSAFTSPGPEFSPVPLWWWSGDPLDRDRLRWQMRQLVAGGVRSAVVLNLAPSGPMSGALADRPEFFTEQWWTLLCGVCSDAAGLGFTLWFYDQLGFSGADIQGRVVRADPSCRGQALDRVVAVVSAPTVLRCPPGADVLAAFAVPVDATDRPTGPPQQFETEGDVARWQGSGRHRVSLAFATDRGFDYLSPPACAALLDAVHGEFERRLGAWFGSTIVGSFQDELPSMPSWTRGFGDEFARRHGYRLEDRLAALWETTAEAAADVRGDYQRTRSALAEEAFFRPLHAWHERHGLMVGCDQQHPARAGYPLEAAQQYGDYFRTHRWFGAPGSDHWGDAKIHSSIAHLYGRPRTWVEAFHSTGWGGTLEETFDWLLPWLRAGANLYDPHAVYYSTRATSWEWAPPSTCWRQPYWRHHPLFADAVARLCSVLSWGTHVCDVAVLFPTASAQAGLAVDEPEELFGRPPGTSSAQDTYLGVVGTMHWFEPSPGALDRLGLDFDVVDDDSVVRGVIDGPDLVVGHERYRALVLPACAVVEAPTLRAVIAFADAGGTVVVVGERPSAVAGTQDDASLRRLAALMAGGIVRFAATPDDLSGALADLPRRVSAPTPTLLRSDGESWVLFVTAAHPRATVADRTWRTTGYDFDAGRYDRTVEITVSGLPEPVALWDPGTATSTQLDARHSDGSLVVTVPLTATPCALVVFGPAAQDHLEAPAGGLRMAGVGAVHDAASSIPMAGWTASLLPTLDNRWGDFAQPPGSPILPQAWHLEHAVGPAAPADDATWSTVRVTEGTWGIAAGPGPAAALPGPADPQDAGALQVDRTWVPLVWSEFSGVPATVAEADPKGFVPEEFLDFGTVAAGDSVQLRIPVRCAEAGTAHLTVGSTADKQLWWNGRSVPLSSSVYYARAPIEAVAGENLLELRLTAPSGRRLRASWAVRAAPDPVPGPEWLTVGDGDRAPTTLTRTLNVERAPTAAVLQLGSVGRVNLAVNGTVVAEHGEFDNYTHVRAARVRRYDVAEHLHAGDNDVVVELCEPGAAAVVDAVAGGNDRRTWLVTDGSWQARRSGTPVTLTSPAEVPHDPRWVQLEPRSHPLRHGGRLQGLPDEPFAVPAGLTAVPRVEWFRFRLPPGATTLRLPVDGDVTVVVDGAAVARDGERHRLAKPAAGGDWCLVRVSVDGGRGGGALWEGPAEVTEWTQGPTALRDWSELGLGDYSGGLRYRASVRASAGTAVLDLGAVRGTAEVRVNGRPAGCRVWSPYRFDVAGLFHDGDNTVEVDVYNTLAPHFGAAGTTPWVLPGQRLSGLLGPVVLRGPHPDAGTLADGRDL